jgi:hypothetical protein
MTKHPRVSPRRTPELERCEGRFLPTLVFVLNGSGYGAAGPSGLSDNAVQVLQAAGHRAVQLAYPALTTTAAYFGLRRQIHALSHGQPIGLVGLSAGGTLAVRLAGDPALHVTAVLDEYGPPDLNDYLNFHGGDRFGRYVREHINSNRRVIRLLSGPDATPAYVVAAFGLKDRNVVAGPSTASFRREIPQARVYDYNGPHGVPIDACRPALDDFLRHL